MNTYLKLVICFACCITFFASCEIDNTGIEEISKTSLVNHKSNENSKSDVRFDVYIRLFDEWSGQEISAGTLPGYGATNIETGELFFDSRYEVGLFENLPIGTYRFDARDGYFDGASSAIVSVSAENETPEGWVEVALQYWSE